MDAPFSINSIVLGRLVLVGLTRLVRCPKQQPPVTHSCCHSNINRAAKINSYWRGVISPEYEMSNYTGEELFNSFFFK